MILSFKTQISGKPTNFVNKIWIGLIENNIIPGYTEIISNYNLKPSDVVGFGVIKPKLHTIRKDEKNRWKLGIMIDFFINARQKNMFRFAPRIPVVSIQKIKIKHIKNDPDYFDHMRVDIDDKSLWEKDALLHLAQNDGFEAFADFAAYFSEDFEGIIIHWTDFKY